MLHANVDEGHRIPDLTLPPTRLHTLFLSLLIYIYIYIIFHVYMSVNEIPFCGGDLAKQ